MLLFVLLGSEENLPQDNIYIFAPFPPLVVVVAVVYELLYDIFLF